MILACKDNHQRRRFNLTIFMLYQLSMDDTSSSLNGNGRRDRHGIEVLDLVRVYEKGPRAVDGVSLRVAPGEIHGFLGPNGAGKSTTVHILTTLLPPTSGTARVAGYDVAKEGPQVRAVIGAALQEAALDPFLTGRDPLRLQGALHGLPR